MLFNGQDAGDVWLPVDLKSRGFEHLDDGVRDLGADAVTGDERDGVFHGEPPPDRTACLRAPSPPNTAARARRRY